jgi:hypothetical protein
MERKKQKRAETGAPFRADARHGGRVSSENSDSLERKVVSEIEIHAQPLGDVSWTVGGYSEQASCCRDVTEYDGVGHMMAALWELPYNYLNWLGISRFGEASLPSYNSTVYLSE